MIPFFATSGAGEDYYSQLLFLRRQQLASSEQQEQHQRAPSCLSATVVESLESMRRRTTTTTRTTDDHMRAAAMALRATISENRNRGIIAGLLEQGQQEQRQEQQAHLQRVLLGRVVLGLLQQQEQQQSGYIDERNGSIDNQSLQLRLRVAEESSLLNNNHVLSRSANDDGRGLWDPYVSFLRRGGGGDGFVPSQTFPATTTTSYHDLVSSAPPTNGSNAGRYGGTNTLTAIRSDSVAPSDLNSARRGPELDQLLRLATTPVTALATSPVEASPIQPLCPNIAVLLRGFQRSRSSTSPEHSPLFDLPVAVPRSITTSTTALEAETTSRLFAYPPPLRALQDVVGDDSSSSPSDDTRQERRNPTPQPKHSNVTQSRNNVEGCKGAIPPVSTASMALPCPSITRQEEKDGPGSTVAVVTAPANLSCPTIARKPRTKRTYTHESFAQKLHRIVTDMEESGRDDIMSFLDEGGLWVHDRSTLVRDIMPLYFRGCTWASFRRQLISYRFPIISNGPNRGAFWNPSFLRGHPELCSLIQRDEKYDRDSKIRPKSTKGKDDVKKTDSSP